MIDKGLILIAFVKQKIRQVPFLYIPLRRLLDSFSIIKKVYRNVFPKRYYHIYLLPNHGNLPEKTALFSYIVHPFSIPEESPLFYRHINIWRTKQIVRLLNELGYIVDLIDYTDTRFTPRKAYDLFIGHGGINYSHILSSLTSETIAINFTTSNYCHFRNKMVADRYAQLSARKKKAIYPLSIFSIDREALAVQRTSGIIGIGDEFSKKTYESFNNVFMLNNTALPDNQYTAMMKNYSEGRNHFLFFAGADNVRKGLDLLLDVFIELDQHLWICSYIDKDFYALYEKELNNYSNIHLVGHVSPRSKIFFDIINRCNYIILPSCSEGQPHSVVEAMGYGLIPIVSSACSLNVGGLGKRLVSCSHDEIKQAVIEFSSLSTTVCQAMSQQIREVIKTDFSITSFNDSLKNALNAIITKETAE